MKSLFWKQPYGSLMLFGKIETRTWNTKYRGPVLICTSKQQNEFESIWNISGKEQSNRLMAALLAIGGIQNVPLGSAIATGNLVDCRPMTPADEDKTFVLYQPGLYCHVYENVKAIRPFPYQGHLSFKAVPQKVIDQIQIIQ